MNALKIALFLLTFLTAAFAALTPQQIADNWKIITSKSQALQAPAQSITIINAPLIVIGQGPFPTIIAGYTELINIGSTAIAQEQGSAPITTAADAKLVADAYREFVRVHQVLLNILIGKGGILGKVPVVGPPVAAVLRQWENIEDTLAFGLIDRVQGQTTDIAAQANSFGQTLTLAINTYSEFSLRRRGNVLSELVRRSNARRSN
ncbi:hypothetical protein HDV00_012009 [Rhizophlyctis rosea]|nr:hypothetical protein HDV00_012009 [Rhizophlyctis rosea]